MSIESFGDGGFCITGDSIPLYRLLVLKQAMSFNIKTGMQLSRINPFPIVRKEFGISAKSKKKVYEEFCNILAEKGIQI